MEELKLHPTGFEYSPMDNGGISVTENERMRYTKLQDISFNGFERDICNDDTTYDLYIENFTQCIGDGGKFYQVDMFGNIVVVTKEELIQFIDENYWY